jgi:hypothetical protein
MTEVTPPGMEATFLKTRAFLLFQSSQAVRSNKEVRPFRHRPFTQEIVHHHSSRESKFAHRLVSKSTSPSHSLRLFHTWIENLQLKMRCTTVSGSLLHSWQGPLSGYPRQMRRSDDHTSFWRIHHAKVLHLGGAQFAQTAGFIKDVGGSINCAK